MRQRFPEGPILRTLAELKEDRLPSEEALHLARARVVLADYELLQHDFPELQDAALIKYHPELERLTGQDRVAAIHQLLDRWLLRNAAFISKRQAEQTRVNTPIETTGDSIVAYRPPRYGRALIVELSSSPGLSPSTGRPDAPRGLLDLKGAGVAPDAEPSHRMHSSGLLSLSDALYDVFLQRLIDELFRRAETRFWSVPVYGVLDLGFDIISNRGDLVPAGLQIRRAHSRPRSGVELPRAGSPEEVVKFEIEMLLRCYGLSSCSEPSAIEITDVRGQLEITHGNQPLTGMSGHELQEVRRLARLSGSMPRYFDGINVQLTREVSLDPSYAQLVDFGHYTIRWGFQHPVLSMVRDRVLYWGGALWPEDPLFVHPDPQLVLPSEFHAYPRPPMGEEVPVRPFRKHRTAPELPQVWANELAHRFHRGEVSTREVRGQLEELLERATQRWPKGH